MDDADAIRLAFARDAAMWIAWAFVLPSIGALIWKAIRPDRPLLVKGRSIIFLLVTLTMSAGVLTNLTFKSYWGRPRPVVVTQFNGPQDFVPWWDPRGSCGRNCSFFSGEGDTAFWTYAPAALDKWATRARLWAAGGMPDDLPTIDTVHKPPIVPRDVFVGQRLERLELGMPVACQQVPKSCLPVV